MSLPAAYVGLIDSLSLVAKGCGYTLALHGSFNRDFDIIAVPWTEEALPAEELIQKLHDDVTYLKIDVALDDYIEKLPTTTSPDGMVNRGRIHGPTHRPHGRRVWSIDLGFGKYLDISVMPRIATPGQRKTKRHTLEERNKEIYCDYVYRDFSMTGLVSKYGLSQSNIEGILVIQRSRRSKMDCQKGIVHPQLDPARRKATNERGYKETGYVLVDKGKLARYGNHEVMTYRQAQLEADRINQDRPTEDDAQPVSK